MFSCSVVNEFYACTPTLPGTGFSEQSDTVVSQEAGGAARCGYGGRGEGGEVAAARRGPGRSF